MVDPNKTEEFRKTLMKLIENPDMAANIGSNGYRALMNYENFDGYIDKTIKIYESILNKKKAH